MAQTPKTLPIRCRCGALSGGARDVTPRRGSRVVCYCKDCQAFARLLGRADELLDGNGGSDIFQLSPARLYFDAGRDRLACIRLRPNGTLRWYARCCNTPLGNTLATPAVPFIGLILACADVDALDEPLDTLIGPVAVRVNGRSARGDLDGLAVHDGLPVSSIVKFLGRVAARRLRGDRERSPLFDPDSGRPVVTPRVLDEAERRALYD